MAPDQYQPRDLPRFCEVRPSGHYKFAAPSAEQMQVRLTNLQGWMRRYARQNVMRAREASREMAELREAIAKATGSAA